MWFTPKSVLCIALHMNKGDGHLISLLSNTFSNIYTYRIQYTRHFLYLLSIVWCPLRRFLVSIWFKNVQVFRFQEFDHILNSHKNFK